MGRFDGGRLIAEMLVREGVRYVFSVSGGPLNPFYKACEELGIQIVHTRHEAAAAFMADGWARATRDPGVCAVTLGPGVTNTLTAVMTAYRATSPMLVIAAQANQGARDLEPGMSIDPIPIMTSVTKWARTVTETARVPEYVAGAYRRATAGRPGPVFLEFPTDVLQGAVDMAEDEFPDPATSRVAAKPQPDPDLVDRAAELLQAAGRPSVVAGTGVWWADASAQLKDLIDQTRLPFFLARGARGAVPEDHPLYFGPAYLPANPVLEKAFRECDLVLMIGHRFDFDLGFGRAPALNPNAQVIQIDIEPAEIGRYRPVQVGLVADAAAAIEALSRAVGSAPASGVSNWRQELAAARDEWWGEMNELAASDDAPMHPLRFLKGVSDVLPDDGVVVTSHGNIDFWADVAFRVCHPGHYLRAGQSGSLGAEIPYGVAAKLAHPDQPVVVIVGDGGFGYHGMELDTAARYDVPLLVAIGNDSAWGAIELPQKRQYGSGIATGLEFRHYEKIAEVLGGYGELVEAPDEVAPAIERALASGQPAVVNVIISQAESRYMYEISK